MKRPITQHRKRPIYMFIVPLITILSLLTVVSLLVMSGFHMSNGVSAQEESRQAFIEKIAPTAQIIQTTYDIPASIIMAQAALESDFGTSELASDYHNLFGIKASQGMDQVVLPTAEYMNDRWVTIKSAFRVYPDWDTSLIDHAQLIRKGTLDNPNRYNLVTTAGSYEQAASGLVQGGYATDPKYADKLVGMIETYGLDKYDK